MVVQAGVSWTTPPPSTYLLFSCTPAEVGQPNQSRPGAEASQHADSVQLTIGHRSVRSSQVSSTERADTTADSSTTSSGLVEQSEQLICPAEDLGAEGRRPIRSPLPSAWTICSPAVVLGRLYLDRSSIILSDRLCLGMATDLAW